MSNETQQKCIAVDYNEAWQKTHAQLLKSVADAQARLLAGINEIADRLVDTNREIVSLNAKVLDIVAPMLGSLENRLMEAHNNHASLTGRLEALLVPPRRPVERLDSKGIVESVKRIMKRQPPQRKQRR